MQTAAKFMQTRASDVEIFVFDRDVLNKTHNKIV